MRAHGTQKTKTKAMCKTGHKHTANENTHKPRVHTRHENMKAHSQWNTQAACHTAQDTTWMHAADKNTNCVHTTRHVDRRAHGRANSRPHAYTTRQNMERECPTRTETQDISAGIRTPCSNTKEGTQTRERTARAHSQPHDHMKTGHDGSVRALSQNPWMTPHWSDRTLTLR